jgi:signal transduction histidine kinase
MAAIGQLAAGIAHEINTPAQYVGDNIRAIGDFFGSLKRLVAFYQTILKKSVDHTGLQSIQSMEEQEELEFILEDAPLAIAQSLEGITQISQIVQAMKGFAHIGHNRLSSADINKSLQNTLLVAKNSYKYIADVETHFGALPAIECYPAELNQVFLNIIVNAAHAIEEKNCGQGLITITTQSVNDEIEIRIDDNGIGIPEDIRNRIFDPFFTTKDVGKGSGQGLNIAYRIVCEQHHGRLTVESRIGVGSTFMIRLPVTFTE